MGVPVVYTDFDGVLNAFPDDKVLRRGGVGHTVWMKADDPRKPLYDAARAFRLDGNAPRSDVSASTGPPNWPA